MTAFKVALSVIKEERGKTECYGVTTDTIQMVLFEKLQHLGLMPVCLQEEKEEKT